MYETPEPKGDGGSLLTRLAFRRLNCLPKCLDFLPPLAMWSRNHLHGRLQIMDEYPEMLFSIAAGLPQSVDLERSIRDLWNNVNRSFRS
jgi:hypothetical protein